MANAYIQDDGQLRVFIVPVDILDVPDLSSSEKLVYIVLRSYVNPTDPTAFPAYETIAKKASLSRRRVIDIVKSLTEKGLILKEHRFNVTKQRKIRNTSNTYTLINPKRAKPSEMISPPPVKSFHRGSETISPEHNHLKESVRNMIDCSGVSAEIAVTAESSSNPIYESLMEHVPKNCFVDGIPLGQEYINQIYLMLSKQLTDRLDPEIVQSACALYFNQACEITPEGRISMKIRIKEPVGFFKKRYEDAIKLYNLQHKSRRKSAGTERTPQLDKLESVLRH